MNIDQYLITLKYELLAESNWQPITLNRSWASRAPDKPGVYVLRENNQIIYVGETGSLKGRMRDLLSSQNHSIRRTIGQKLYSSLEGFVKVDQYTKFPPAIEELLDQHISTNLQVAYLPVALGRKELEELVDSELEASVRLNKRGRRRAH